MNLLRQITMRADDVCAFLWERSNFTDRSELCQESNISDAIQVLGWYELGANERIPLLRTIVDRVETSASLLRVTQNHPQQQTHPQQEETPA